MTGTQTPGPEPDPDPSWEGEDGGEAGGRAGRLVPGVAVGAPVGRRGAVLPEPEGGLGRARGTWVPGRSGAGVPAGPGGDDGVTASPGGRLVPAGSKDAAEGRTPGVAPSLVGAPVSPGRPSPPPPPPGGCESAPAAPSPPPL